MGSGDEDHPNSIRAIQALVEATASGEVSGMGGEDEISPADARGAPGKDQQAAGVGILLQIMMLVLSFVLGHVLRRKRIYVIPEASASLLIGTLILIALCLLRFLGSLLFSRSFCEIGLLV